MNYWNVICRFALIILAVLCIFGLVCVFLPKCYSIREYQRQKAELQEQNRETEVCINGLIRNQRRFESDPEFVEKTAREIGMVKTNETLFKFSGN